MTISTVSFNSYDIFDESPQRKYIGTISNETKIGNYFFFRDDLDTEISAQALIVIAELVKQLNESEE
mgnify:CR=1 FL=1